MASLSASSSTVLDILNQELGSAFTDIFSALRSYTQEQMGTAVGICGFPCVGDCSTCTEAVANLEAFFAPEADPAPPAEPVSVPIVSEASASAEGNSSSSAEEGEIEDVARARDEADEIRATGIWADTGEDYIGDNESTDSDESSEYYDERDDYDDRYYDDGGYDNGWNESGYCDY
jgi:hypothetical protein